MISELEELVQSGQFSAALLKFQQMLQGPQLPSETKARAYHAASIAAYRCKRFHSAVEFAWEAERLARATGNNNLLGRVWQNMGVFLRRDGQFGQAVAVLKEWLQKSNLFPELANRAGEVHLNLGSACRSNQQDDDALVHFRKASDLLMDAYGKATDATPEQQATWIVDAGEQAAWILYERGELDAGDELRMQIMPFVSGEGRAFLLTATLETFGAYCRGNFDFAVELAQSLLTDPLLTATEQFWLQWVVGMIATRRGQWDTANLYASLVADNAEELRESRYLDHAATLYNLVQTEKRRAAGQESSTT